MVKSSFSLGPGTRTKTAKQIQTVERRTAERMRLTLAAELMEMPAGARIKGRMSDCCMFGCFVDTINTFPDRTAVRLRLWKGQEMFEAEAVVAYSQLQLGMGVAFTYVSQENRRLLESWMARGKDQQMHGMAPVSPEPELRAMTSQSEQFSRLVYLMVAKGILKDAEVRELLGNSVI
jgi:hypothetical protein